MAQPPYRMIAIDLDGTLLRPDHSVSPRVKDAIHKVLRAGMLVCFATGRNLTESQAILDSISHYDTAVFVGGAMIVDTREGKTLHRTGMQPQLAREVCAVIESLGHAALVLEDTSQTGVDYLISAGIELSEATRNWIATTRAAVRRVANLASYPHQHTVRVGICAPRAEVERVRDILCERFGSRIVCQVLYVPPLDMEVMEVFDPAVNKWEGVLHVARRHGIKPEQIIAIGDDVNDLPMIRNAGLGVAMGNARPEVRQAAKLVIKPNSEDGLAEFLEDIVRQHLVAPENPPPAGRET